MSRMDGHWVSFARGWCQAQAQELIPIVPAAAVAKARDAAHCKRFAMSAAPALREAFGAALSAAFDPKRVFETP